MTQPRRFARLALLAAFAAGSALAHESPDHNAEIGRASCRERV